MSKNERLVLCGGSTGHHGQSPHIALDLRPRRGNVHLEIANFNKRLLANIPDGLIDLLEIASYVYAADSAVSRGGTMDAQMGAQWRRRFRFVIPVRLPALWSSSGVMSPLVETLSFLSEDDYQFEFQRLVERPATTDYFELPDADVVGFTPNEVVLFSGGLDSLAGAIEEVANQGKKVVLVSHRSSPKIEDTQNYLVSQLRARFGPRHILHVPIRMTLDSGVTREYTHRTRSFLFVALGAVTARLFGKTRCCFFENGVTSLNLPPIGQVVGARASRTTHPQALAGFSRLLSQLFGHQFEVDNPFVWLTKSEVVERVAANRCADLIRHTRSCSRVRDMTKIHSHCGECSQCIDRRFAILAAGQDKEDPAEAYKTDLFTGEREPGPDRELALAYVRTASKIENMTDIAFFSHYGEASRVVKYFADPANTVGSRIFELHQRNAAGVCAVFKNAINALARELLQGRLPKECLLLLVVSQQGNEGHDPEPREYPARVSTETRAILLATDQATGCVAFQRWGELKGVCAELMIVLAAPFRAAMHDGRSPTAYPFTPTTQLVRQLKCRTDGALRRRVLRCRTAIAKLAQSAGDPCRHSMP